MAAIRRAIYEVAEADRPVTIRQVFYRLTVLGKIPKTEAGYKLVCRQSAGMRKGGELPFRWIADATRWQRKPQTYSSLTRMLEYSQQTYRRALWGNQRAYVEVWLEKEALAGVLYQVTGEWDVPLMVCRGYASLSFLHAAAEAIAEEPRPCFLYYVGDHDPSGVDISRVVEEGIRTYAPDADVHFQRVAVLPSQIRAWNLPTRPTKQTDTRSKRFKGDSVEVDAIEPARLRQLVEDAILRHVDQAALEQLRAVEREERNTLEMVIEGVAEAGDGDDWT